MDYIVGTGSFVADSPYGQKYVVMLHRPESFSIGKLLEILKIGLRSSGKGNS